MKQELAALLSVIIAAIQMVAVAVVKYVKPNMADAIVICINAICDCAIICINAFVIKKIADEKKAAGK